MKPTPSLSQCYISRPLSPELPWPPQRAAFLDLALCLASVCWPPHHLPLLCSWEAMAFGSPWGPPQRK